MAVQTQTSTIVAKESLAILKNKLPFSRGVNRDYDGEYAKAKSGGYLPGSSISIRRPDRSQYRAGRVAVPQNSSFTTVPATLVQGGVDKDFTGLDETFNISQMGKIERLAESMAAAVANQIEVAGLDLARRTVFNNVGTVGVTPNTQALTLALMAQGHQRLDENAADRGDSRKSVVSPAMNAALAQGMAFGFNPNGDIGKTVKTGLLQDFFGSPFELGQNVVRHQNGTQAATGLTVSTAGQTGSTLAVAATTGNITAGTRFTITSGTAVNSVNPQSRGNTGILQSFVVTADVPAGATSLPISPSITPTGSFQNVTASPSAGAAITFLGAASASYDANLLYHRDAFSLIMVPIEPIKGLETAIIEDEGFSMRMTRVPDGINYNNIIRLDVLFAWVPTYPELACLLVS